MASFHLAFVFWKHFNLHTASYFVQPACSADRHQWHQRLKPSASTVPWTGRKWVQNTKRKCTPLQHTHTHSFYIYPWLHALPIHPCSLHIPHTFALKSYIYKFRLWSAFLWKATQNADMGRRWKQTLDPFLSPQCILSAWAPNEKHVQQKQTTNKNPKAGCSHSTIPAL